MAAVPTLLTVVDHVGVVPHLDVRAAWKEAAFGAASARRERFQADAVGEHRRTGPGVAFRHLRAALATLMEPVRA